ncbi:MAG: (Fe-S)-binding protein [Bernardetiaceae bacterium]|nr:(Fe-S)-binding protein [Bernardetiaceae bacterium]
MGIEIFSKIFQIGLFWAALLMVGTILASRIKFIRRNILLGKSWKIEDDAQSRSQRLKNMLLIAFGQKKMFDKPLVGFMHFVLYAGFLIVNIEVLEIILDGMLGTHRLFAPFLGEGLYMFLVGFFEFVALNVLIFCVVFLIRRNVLKVRRFHKAEMTKWPTLDGNLILIFEIALMLFLFTMNASDSILQARGVEGYVHEGLEPLTFLVSQAFIPLYSGLGDTALILLERCAWWAHILGIMGFAVYITYSKHLHVGLAFPNTYFTRLTPAGEMRNMDNVTQEVKIALGLVQDDAASMEEGEMERFGAKDANELSWKSLLDAYTCTECGRCTEQCPANQTGRLLSPRKIMMDTRDRIEEIGYNIDANQGEFVDDGKSLYGDYISKEELMACTTCNACVDACPVNINPLDIIVELRRYIAMEEADVPDAWKAMVSNVGTNAAPWAMSASDRFNWADDLLEKE